MESVECGAASLAMVLASHGHHAPLAEVREACRASRDGVDAHVLIEAAGAYGLEAEGFQAEVEDLATLPLPAVLHWGLAHFVVLERFSDAGAFIVDPAGGRRVVATDELRQRFSGIVVTFRPAAEFRQRQKARPSLERSLRVARKVLPTVVQSLAASSLLLVLTVVPPVSTQLLVDQVILPRQEPWLWALGLALAGVALTRAVLSVVRTWTLQRLEVALNFEVTASFLRHLLHLPASFFLRRQTGDLVQRVQGATGVLSWVTTRAMGMLLDALQLVAYGALMFVYSARIAAVVLGLGLARLAILLGLRQVKRQWLITEQAALGRESGAQVEAFSAIETTRGCGVEGHVFRRWADRAVDRANSALPRQQLDLSVGALMAFLQTAALAVIFWLGGHEVLAGAMTLGTFTALLTLQPLFMGPLQSILTTFDQLQYLGVHLLRLDDVLETPPEPSGSVVLSRLEGAIDIEQVMFAYSLGAPPALQGIDLAIGPGQKVALVGPTGSGKSTLARLLLGMYPPTAGRVRFDGHDSRTLDLASLRRQVGVVMQDTFLFEDTIRANLSLGRDDVSLEAMRRAARLACIDEVIEALPEAYETRLGENGATLSAGQRQRLALARAVVHEPAILLLDEATSALDRETEARIHANLAGLRATCLLITHRVSTVSDADWIVVLDRGRIRQSGRYQELARQPGLFRDLVAAAQPAAPAAS